MEDAKQDVSIYSKVKEDLYLLQQESKWIRLILLLNKRKHSVKRRLWVRKNLGVFTHSSTGYSPAHKLI